MKTDTVVHWYRRRSMRTPAIFATLAMSAAVLTAAAEATTVSAPLALSACPTDLAVTPAGAVALLTRTQARGRWSASTAVIDPAGMITAGPSVSRAWKRPSAVRSVFTGEGVAVAFESRRPGASGGATRPTVSVTMAGPGAATSPQVVSDRRRSAELYRVTSRGGTTVVHFRQTVPGKLWLQDWIAVRPANARRFRKAVSLQSAIRDRFSDDRVYLGPDGSGVVVSVPVEGKLPVSARRITSEGRVGGPIPFGRRAADIPEVTAVVGSGGQIIVAVVDTAKPNSYGLAGLFVALLAPETAAFSRPKLAGTARYATGQVADALALGINDAGQVIATIGRQFKAGSRDEYDPGFHTFSGTGDQLARGPDIDGILSVGDSPVLTPTTTGSFALTWEGDELAGGDDFRRAQYVAFQAPDGTWSRPTTISPPFLWTPGSFALNRSSAALPGGGLVMAYAVERPGRKTVCSLVRVTP